MTARTENPTAAEPFDAPLQTYHRPLIPIVIALATGIFFGGTFPHHLPWAAAIGLTALACIAWSWRRKRRSNWAPIIVTIILGYGLISPWLPGDFPERHVSHYTDSHRWQIQGNVVEHLPNRHGRVRFVLAVTQLRHGTNAIPATGRIRVTLAGASSPISPGTSLSFSSRIRSFHNFNNPGGFDYRRYMAFQRIHGTAFVHAERIQMVSPPSHDGDAFLRRFRARARRLMETYPHKESQSVLKALLVGDRDALSPELRRVFNRCGVGHLLAISGLHIGIVGGFVFGICLWLLHRTPFILDRGWGRRAATVMAVGPVLFYAFLAGLSPATQRALIMVLAFMATYFVHRDGDTLNFLALAALLMLIARPPALFSISFQMSFAAVFWIVSGFSQPRDRALTNACGPAAWRQRLLSFLLVTCWATAGTLPLTMRYFQEVSLVGLVANCFMVPLIGLFVLPVGLLSLGMLLLHAGLAVWGIQTAGWGLQQGLHILQVLSSLDAVAVQTFVPTLFEIACYYGALGLIAMRRAFKPLKWGMLLILLLVCGDGLYWGYQRLWHRDLRITVMDVGQGSASLVEFPGGATMLIDGGGTTDNRYFDMGARVVAPFLRSRKILQVDTVVLSHPSSDHMNGLVYILTHFRPKQLLWGGDRTETVSFRRFFEAALQSGADIPPWPVNGQRMDVGGVAVDILNPQSAPPKGHAHSAVLVNNRSIVVKLTLDDCAILFPGDIEAEAEADLLGCCRFALPSQILVVPHHGSRTSSTPGFIDAVAPRVAIVSAGWRNRFGFPHHAVLERYQQRRSRIYRTDRHGAISLRTRGHYWKVQAQLE